MQSEKYCFAYEPILAPRSFSQDAGGPGSRGNCCVPPGPTSPLVHADLAVIHLSPDPMERTVFPGHLFVQDTSGSSGHKVQKSDSHKSVPECRIAPPLSLQNLRTLYLSIEPCKVPTWTISIQISRSVTTDRVWTIASSREDNKLHPAEIFRNTEVERGALEETMATEEQGNSNKEDTIKSATELRKLG